VQRRASDQASFTEIDFDAAGDKLTPAQEEEQALRRYAALASLCDAAIARGDNTALQPLLRSTGEAHKLLYAIRENRASYEERMRDLVPASEVTELFRSRIEPVKAALQAMPKFLASQIDPVHPDPIEDMIRQEVVRILYAASGTSGMPLLVNSNALQGILTPRI